MTANAVPKAASKAPGATDLDAAPCSSQLTQVECAYVGAYDQGGVDWMSGMRILDDHTYCFTASAGSLDLLVAGTWALDDGTVGAIRLREVRPANEVFPALTRGDGAEGQKPKVVFTFRGDTLVDARSPVFGVSSSETPPTSMRPLFEGRDATWHVFYSLPPMAREKARYVFIGDIENWSSEHPERLRVTQYAVGGANEIRLAYDSTQAKPPMDASAVLEDGILWMDGQHGRTRRPLTTKMIEKTREFCTDRLRNPQQSATEPQRYRQEDGVWTSLVRVKTFYLDPSVMQGKAWFNRSKK